MLQVLKKKKKREKKKKRLVFHDDGPIGNWETVPNKNTR